MLLQPDVHVDPVGPQVDVSAPDRSRAANARCSACHCPVSRVITAADRPAEEPRNWPSAGTKSPLDRPCRYSSGSTSVIFGVFRAHGGKIAEENRFRSPVCGSGALVVDPRHGHLHRARTGQRLPRLVIAIPHHQPAAVLVPLRGERRDIGVHLGLQRLGQHPPRTLPHDLIDQRPRAARFLP